MRLITIPVSHYCERARWALDHAGVAYREEQHLQCFHWPYALGYGGRKTLPLLLGPRATLRDSADIVRFADAHARDETRRLYPASAAARREIERLERSHADELGVATRLLMYFHFFNWGPAALPLNDGCAPLWERAAIRALFYPMRALLQRYVGIDDAALQRARDEIARRFDEAAEQLSDGRRYLFGDRFSAADLTFAAMAAILVIPERYGVPLPALYEFPAEVRADIEPARAHPAGRFVLRVYREHRELSKASRD